MKKIVLALAILSPFAAILSPLRSQEVREDSFSQLRVSYQTPAPVVESRLLAGDKLSTLSIAGFIEGGEVGSPMLPVRNDIIVVPFCDSIAVTVANAVYDTLQVSTLYPLQPSRSKSDTVLHDPVVDAARYATDELWGMPLASVQVMGVARDRRLARLSFSPVKVNPVSGMAVVCRSADVTVHYIGADAEATQTHFDRYFSPYFSAGTTLNTLVDTKNIRTNGLKRMVVVLGNYLGNGGRLGEFLNWKRRQGFRVDLLYYSNYASNSALADSLKALFENADDDNPAPNYLLLIGDKAELPPFNSRIASSSSMENDHVTDLYFATWTPNDILPDCYRGRFSVSDTTTLNAVIAKTMLYESYGFSDDSYLARAALIAGEDNGYHTDSWDNAWRYADPSMDYLAKTYINAEHGFDSVVYYKNNVDFAPEGVTVTGYCSASGTAAALTSFYNTGVGLINYSAHGDWDEWYKPRFKVSNANAMTNIGMPSIMIGNCCLTNKFDKEVCLGEALLRRKNNAGAVVYLGGTNYTYWSQDFYWSVGVRRSINNTINTSYQPSNRGAYDHLFHTHGELFTDWEITAGGMIFSGNTSVNSSSSSDDMIKYYWEIYELMGDPSLLPWLGRASDLTLSGTAIGHTVTLNVEPYSYVAFIDSATLDVVAARFIPSSGTATIAIPDNIDLHSLIVSVTTQGYKPYIRLFDDTPVGISRIDAVDASLYPNPATDRCTVSAEGLRSLELIDALGRVLLRRTANNSCTLDLAGLNAGLYLVRLHTDSGIAVKKLIVNK